MAEPSDIRDAVRRFFLPRISRWYLLRVCLVALAAWLFFGYICLPCVIRGGSMLPTYGTFGFTFCWCPSYWFHAPQVGDVVAASFFGRKMLLLKRVVAVEGETVEFRGGRLYVDGVLREGGWETLGPCDWELPPRLVEPGNVYLVGDNRSMPIDGHLFGQLSARRVMGKPLW